MADRYIDWTDERKVRYDEARGDLEAAIRRCVAIANEDSDDVTPDDQPYVQGWLAVAEWTNVELERQDAGGRFVISPQGVMLSTQLGLAAWAAETFQ